MNPIALVAPLEDPWQAIIDEVLRERGAPPMADVSRLGPKLVALSRAYNSGLVGGSEGPKEGRDLPLEARIAFSFTRDVPKASAAVRELVATGALALPPERPLRVLDLGAGLGAMTWGIARALEAAGQRGRIEALLVDEDEAALTAASAIARRAQAALGERPVSVSVRTRSGRLRPGLELPAVDVVIVGQVLSELDRAQAPELRVTEHAALLADLLERCVLPGGALVVVEPALRDRTRHLQAVRDRLVKTDAARIFAPCLHHEACPSLAIDGDWCHDDLRVDLPKWLVPLARAAGLRFQGLTFSYLVLRRRDEGSLGATLAERLPEPASSKVHLRVVSNVLRTKGKTEVFGCTSDGRHVRVRRLDRDATEASARWEELTRGDIVTLASTPEAGGADLTPPIDERGRTSRGLSVDVWPFHK